MTEKESKLKYDLEERTVVFAEKIIELLQTIRPTAINQRIISQLVGSSGSVGANYCEAIEAESKKDFVHRLAIAQKEIGETIYWLELLKATNYLTTEHFQAINVDAIEILKLLTAIIKTAKNNQNNCDLP